MSSRVGLHWHHRSGPDDAFGFLGVFGIAQAYRESHSGVWLWSVSWVSGIGARGSAPDRDAAVRAAEEAVGGFVSQSGLTEKEITNL